MPFFVWGRMGYDLWRSRGEIGWLFFDDILSGNWATGLAIGVGAVVVLPLTAPMLRPLAKTAIKGGILAYRARLECSKASVISSPKPYLPRRRRKWQWKP